MLLYRPMTKEEFEDLRARTEAAINTDIKEYRSLVALLGEWTLSKSMVNQFMFGAPDRYIGKLRSILRTLAQITNYPKLIDSVEARDKKYIANIPTRREAFDGKRAESPVPEPKRPEGWGRYDRFDDYKDRLTEALRKEGEENLTTWFTERRRLHDTAKNLEIQGASAQSIAAVLELLAKQDEQIQDYFDRVEACMRGETKETATDDTALEKPSGTYTKAQIDAMADPVFAALSKEKRVTANYAYLRRKDIKNPNMEEMELRRNELIEWGYEVE